MPRSTLNWIPPYTSGILIYGGTPKGVDYIAAKPTGTIIFPSSRVTENLADKTKAQDTTIKRCAQQSRISSTCPVNNPTLLLC
ncbi:MAG: hypothetical protein HRT36_07610 [Alphaproteobacteria bacterium]|nr:hypothetical protein [Alphaproteobacteria bacterium]